MKRKKSEDLAALVAQEIMERIEMRERVARVRDQAISRLQHLSSPASSDEAMRSMYGAFKAGGSTAMSDYSPSDPELVNLIAQAVVDKLADESVSRSLVDEVAARVLEWRCEIKGTPQ